MRREWEPEDLIACWTLVEGDAALVGNKSGPTRLGFALLLKFFELEGRFPRHVGELPEAAVKYVAQQVDVDAADLASYNWSGRAIKYHRAQIRQAYGFREATRSDEDHLDAWLSEEVCPVEFSEARLREALLARCRAERFEPPWRLERILAAAPRDQVPVDLFVEEEAQNPDAGSHGEPCPKRQDRMAMAQGVLVDDESVGEVPARSVELFEEFEEESLGALLALGAGGSLDPHFPPPILPSNCLSEKIAEEALVRGVRAVHGGDVPARGADTETEQVADSTDVTADVGPRRQAELAGAARQHPRGPGPSGS
ncbi:MAG: DUF4158 domain-containing protein [Acidimicrobiales bacterium]